MLMGPGRGRDGRIGDYRGIKEKDQYKQKIRAPLRLIGRIMDTSAEDTFRDWAVSGSVSWYRMTLLAMSKLSLTPRW
ncbi:hypothetical protein EYF80_044774 [Liparis tanakae]|uniref:Uncharacterized protein n=1 Tax=Liparis tanakae TaxID=230148 RepID=A0A4Z2FUT2_9TELE|nr:hypothetical protein EYF80_044774 [Liparis tanakae]